MNNELRLHLSARRPSGQDDADPAIADALARAGADPQTAAWAEAEKQSDASVAVKLREVQPPPGLRDTILAGARVGRRRWWQWFEGKGWRNLRNSELVAIAALVMILAIAITTRYWLGRGPESWQAAAVGEVAKIEAFEIPVNQSMESIDTIRDWMVKQTCPRPGTLPAPVNGLKIAACTKMNWRGTPMSIVCFNLGDGREVHLVTISRRGLPVSPPVGVPEYGKMNGYNTASWSEGDAAMMLVGKIEEAELHQLMGEKPTANRS